MEFVVNDLSLHGQLPDLAAFQRAVARLMEIRQAIMAEGSALYCHRNLLDAHVTPAAIMKQAVQVLPKAQRSAWILWLTNQGPFWEDARMHSCDTWLEVQGEIVTDSAIGETAFCRAHGLDRELISFAPSRWLFTPIGVKWVRAGGSEEDVLIPNHWELTAVRRSLMSSPLRIDSWKSLEVHMRRVCARLTFSEDAFGPLDGCPFALSAAERIQVLLRKLDQLRGCVDDEGRRDAEGHRLYHDHFTGDNAWFSDSSATEKVEFRDLLTFTHPTKTSQAMFCPWHGKVKTQQLRIHFSWPVNAHEPLYVVYVGPKRTKR